MNVTEANRYIPALNRIAQVLAKLPDLKAWAADVEAHALSLAVNQGKTWPGFKRSPGWRIRTRQSS